MPWGAVPCVAGCLQPDWRGSGGQTAHGSLVPGCIHRSDDSGERPLLVSEETWDDGPSWCICKRLSIEMSRDLTTSVQFYVISLDSS
jgi:hypothetical protein